jgi:hypothetical protein
MLCCAMADVEPVLLSNPSSSSSPYNLHPTIQGYCPCLLDVHAYRIR